MNPQVHPNLCLVIGGSRSGKSRFAEELCEKLQRETGLKVTYLATCSRLDPEMEERIALHRDRRPADWETIEEPSNLADRIRTFPPEQTGILLVDCLSLLLSNWMWEHGEEVELSIRTKELIEVCKKYPHPVVVVTSEVGAGIVPETRILRAYRDGLGLMNQWVAREADAVFAVIAGIPVNIKQFEVHL